LTEIDKSLGVADTDWKIPAPYGVSIAGDRVLEMDESEPSFRDTSHEEHVTGPVMARKLQKI
jgi:hypothetical protein